MIPEIHKAFIKKAKDILFKDNRIVGLALGGSYITGQMDDYSDLDFVVAVSPKHLEDVMDERLDIAGQLGVLLSAFTGEHIGVPALLICLYDAPLLHVDFHFVIPETKKFRIEDPVILFEKENALSSILGTSSPMEPETKNQWYEDRFWVWVHYIATKIGRGELFEALNGITFLRENVLGPMIQINKGIFPRGNRFIERDAPEYVPKLIETVAAYSPESCVKALWVTIDLYLTLRLSHKDKIILRAGTQNRAIEYLSDLAKADI